MHGLQQLHGRRAIHRYKGPLQLLQVPSTSARRFAALQAMSFTCAFSDSAQAAMQGELTGRLLAYHPKVQKTTVVAEGFLYSNGVAVSADADYVALVETGAWRVWKIWLSGDKVSLGAQACRK